MIVIVAPIQDLYAITIFADDKFPLASHHNLNTLITNFEEKLRLITKWLKDSGLKINEEKTEVCLFHRNDHAPITISLNGVNLKSKLSINVLGVQFDCKLSWNAQVNQTINKAKKTLHAINLIKKHFNTSDSRP